MLKLPIQGLAEGESAFELEESVGTGLNIAPEFKGVIRVSGTIRKSDNRYIIHAVASADALLVCDLSLEEYTELIEAQIDVVAIVGDEARHDDSFIVIREDDKYIDLTEDAEQELALNLPMKAVSPKYRNTSFYELYPDVSAEANQEKNSAEDRWAVLKNFKFDSHN